MFGSSRDSNSNSSNDSGNLEKLIKRATDETLTTDNWQYILEVCDKISQDPETSTKQAIKIVSSRLSLKDANVSLRTLSLIVAIAENCGSRMKQEIATSSFLDTILKKLSDKKIHVTVKFKIAEVVKQLYDSFKGDPSLKPMTVAYEKLKKGYPQYLGSSNGSRGVIGSASSRNGPNKPAKREILQEDKAKEDEELQRVLKDSLKEYEKEQDMKKVYLNKPLPAATETNSGQTGGADTPPEQTIATVTKVRALYDLISYEPDELSFRKNDIITVLESVYRDWWKGSLPNGDVGIFPLNYVTPVVTKSTKELAAEFEIELKILTIDQKKVEKLLAILSSPQQESINEDEVTTLYNEIVPIRPTLGKFIDKYSVRKEELLQLNTQLNCEAKVYNELMDKLISQRAHQAQHTGNVPYPHAFNQNTQPQLQQQSQYPEQPHQQQLQLMSQPTSSGFGNGTSDYSQYQRISSPSQSFFAPQYPGQIHTPVQSQAQQEYQQPYQRQAQQPPHAFNRTESTQFLNIRNFPDVNNI